MRVPRQTVSPRTLSRIILCTVLLGNPLCSSVPSIANVLTILLRTSMRGLSGYSGSCVRNKLLYPKALRQMSPPSPHNVVVFKDDEFRDVVASSMHQV